MSIIENAQRTAVEKQKAQAYDNMVRAQYEEGLARNAYGKGMQTGAMRPLNVELGPSAGQRATSGYGKNGEFNAAMDDVFYDIGPGWVTQEEVADQVRNSPTGQDIYDRANRQAADSLAAQAYAGQQAAMQELVQSGYTPEQAQAMVSNIGRL